MPTLDAAALQQRAAAIRWLVLDVDGVLTDGRLWYGNSGEELKAFDIQDGLGIKLLQRGGIQVAVITGRQSQLVARRTGELGITRVTQGREDKLVALRELCASIDTPLDSVAYMGDDLPDLSALMHAGLALVPANARPELAAVAHYQTSRCGGNGAVREAGEWLLRATGRWDAIVEAYRQ
jgi:3-deoxy-D-manno-octulosonate 8-phosphate phosphatase (KDO 8-P phosphatase)